MRKILTLSLLVLSLFLQGNLQTQMMGRMASQGVVETWTANNATISAYDSYLTAGWQFSNGAITTDSVGSNTLTNNSATNPSGGINGYCVEMNGSNQYLSIADNTDISPTTDLVISVWVNRDNNSGAQEFFAQYSSPYSVYRSYIDGSGNTFKVTQSDNTQKSTVYATKPTHSTWVHLCYVADSTAGKTYIYYDGSEVGTPTAYDGTIKDVSTAFYIGCLYTGSASYVFDGKMDEFMFWKNPSFANDTAREAFVTALYNSGTGSFYIP